jgi:hypothetical protein
MIFHASRASIDFFTGRKAKNAFADLHDSAGNVRT